MTVWNGELFLREAISSIQDQSFGDFEFIIVDDGSTDRTADIIREVASQDFRIRLVSCDHAGQAAAANAGANMSSGEYLARLDADDISYPERLAQQIDFLDTHPDHVLLGTASEEISADGSPLSRSERPFYTEDCEIRAYMPAACPFTHSSVMMRRTAFIRAGGYRPAFDGAEDYDLFARLAQLGKVANLRTTMIKTRHHRNQISSRQLEKQMLADLAVKQMVVRFARGEEDPFLNVTGRLAKTDFRRLAISDEAIDLHVLDGFENWAQRVWCDGDKADSAAVLKRALDFARQSSLPPLRAARYGFLLAACHLRQKQLGAAIGTASRTLLSAPAYPFAWVVNRLLRAN